MQCRCKFGPLARIAIMQLEPDFNDIWFPFSALFHQNPFSALFHQYPSLLGGPKIWRLVCLIWWHLLGEVFLWQSIPLHLLTQHTSSTALRRNLIFPRWKTFCYLFLFTPFVKFEFQILWNLQKEMAHHEQHKMTKYAINSITFLMDFDPCRLKTFIRMLVCDCFFPQSFSLCRSCSILSA